MKGNFIMKPTFKTTAVAILVALGVTACNTPSNQNRPVNPQPEAKPQLQPETKPQPQPEAKPQLQPEAKPQPQPEAKPQPQPESKPQPQPEAKPQPQPESKPQPQPEVKPQPQLEVQPQYNFEANKLASDGKEWRVAQLEKGVIFPSSRFAGVNTVGDYLAGGSGVINFNKLSSDKLGTFSGKAKDDTYVVDDKIQPYSSYGILYGINGFTQNDVYKFGLVQTKPLIAIGENYGVENGQLVYKSNTLENNLPKGGITYKGDIFAEITTMENMDSEVRHQVKQDGSVVLEAYLNADNNNKAMAKGVINSDTLGEIKLLNTEISLNGVTGKTAYKDNVGQYNAQFGGVDFNDMVGEAELSFYEKYKYVDREKNFEKAPVVNGNKVVSYEAVFGGTK